MTTDCGPVIVLPSCVFFKVMFLLKIMLIYDKPWGLPLNGGSAVVKYPQRVLLHLILNSAFAVKGG